MLFAVFFASFAQAQTEKKRVIEKTFDGQTALWASHRYGDVLLRRSNSNQIKVILTVIAKGKDEQEIQEFLNQFDYTAVEAPDNKLDVQTAHLIESWNTINGNSTIKLKNGKKYNGIKDFSMQLEIFVPKLRYATLENKYATIRAEDGTAAILAVNLYDGNIDLGGNYEQLNLDIKYSDGAIGNFTNCSAVLYDSDINFGNGKYLEIDSKYSGVKVGNLESLKLECYDDNYKIGAVSGQSTIRDKYSEFRFTGNIGSMAGQFYDSALEALNADRVQISESKYTEYVFEELNSFHFDLSFDDAVKISKVGALSAGNTKYTEYNVGGLWKSLTVNESFDDEIKVRTVGGTFEGMVFHGKYTDVVIPIPASVKYELNAELKYSDLIYPENDMETTYFKEKNEEKTIKGKMKGAGANAPKIDISSYDGDIRL